MTEHNHAHFLAMAAIWRQLPGEAQTLTAEGSLSPTANPFAVAFSEDLSLVCGTLWHGGFLELWEEKQFLVVSIFDDEDVRDSFQRTDFKLMRTAAFSNNALGHLDGEDNTPFRSGGSREIRLQNCQEIMEDVGWSSRARKSSWHIKHTTRAATTASGPECEYQLSRINVSIAAENLQTVPQRRITSSIHAWTRGTCRTAWSHMTWALEEITPPTSCNICALDCGDLQT